MSSHFTFVSYEGPDAGRVLVAMLADESDGDPVHKIVTETERRVIGFQPNPDEEPGEENDDPENSER